MGCETRASRSGAYSGLPTQQNDLCPSILPVLATHGLLRHNRNDIGGQKQWRRLLTLFRPSRRHAAYSAPAATVRAPRRLSLIRWITAQFPPPENPDRMAAHACPERRPDADIDIYQPEYHGSPLNHTAALSEARTMLPESSSRPLPAKMAHSRNLAHAPLETAVSIITLLCT